jgi:hypothetical protein
LYADLLEFATGRLFATGVFGFVSGFQVRVELALRIVKVA